MAFKLGREISFWAEFKAISLKLLRSNSSEVRFNDWIDFIEVGSMTVSLF